MHSRYDLRKSSKERIGFVLFAIALGSLVWLTHSSASKLARSMDSEAASINAKTAAEGYSLNVVSDVFPSKAAGNLCTAVRLARSRKQRDRAQLPQRS